MPAVAGEPLGRRHPRLRHAHDHVGLGRRLLGQLLAHADAGLVHALPVEAAVRPGEVHELEQAEVGIDLVGREGVDLAPGLVDDHHLAGVELADEVAPTMSSAGVSDASTWPPSSSLPRHSGRNPWGSRTPMTRASSMMTRENAPSSRTITSATACSRASGSPGWWASSAAISSATRSLSLVTVPSSMPASFTRASVLTRLPLWPSANMRSSTER